MDYKDTKLLNNNQQIKLASVSNISHKCENDNIMCNDKNHVT